MGKRKMEIGRKTIKKVCDITFLKFIVVGIINTLVGTGVMFVSYNFLALNYWVSSALNYIVGSIVSYFLNKRFTFKNEEKSIFLVLKFVFNICICYLISYGFAKKMIYFILVGYNDKIRDNVSMLIGMVFFVVLNYIGQRFCVFGEKAVERMKG